MNVLFLTLVDISTIYKSNLYGDLMREFVKHGHRVYIVSPVEQQLHQDSHLIEEKGATILKLKIGTTQKTGNIIKKGISTVMIEPTVKAAIKKYFSDVKFDLVLYSTPPITLVGAVEFVKKRDHATTYLMLKDIFPQNAVDLGMMTKAGPKGLIYRHFRQQEKRLYRVSDRIGCMSPANVDFVLKHNSEIPAEIVEVCPNSIDPVDNSVDEATRVRIRQKYGIPLDKNVFIYGGNLGRPQGIPFLIECLEKCKDIDEAFFVVVGSGSEYHLLEEYVKKSRQRNLKLMRRIPHEDYDTLVAACDVGLIFLDHRFTIPNFPCRLLSYMLAKLPILACTDPNTDLGKVITDGGFGWWCESNDALNFRNMVQMIVDEKVNPVDGNKEFSYLEEYFSAQKAYNIIEKSVGNNI